MAPPMSREKEHAFIGFMLLPLRAERGASSRQRHDLERGTSSIMTSRPASSWNDILRDVHKNLERMTVRLSVCAFLHQQQLEPLDDSTLLATTSAQASAYAIALDIGANHEGELASLNEETANAMTTRRNRAHPNGTKALEKYVVR